MNLLLIGGDRRQYYMAKFLSSKGFAVSYFGELFFGGVSVKEIRKKEKLFEELDKGMYDSVVLPIPVGADAIKGCLGKLHMRELIKHLTKVKRIYGGVIPNAVYGLTNAPQVIDLMRQEDVMLENAALTAENALMEAVLISDRSVLGSESLVIGYGRCGQMLVDRLKGLRANVTVAEIDRAKKSLAKSYGVKTTEVTSLQGYDFIFQTAPGYEMDKKLLMTCLAEDDDMPVIIDISSNSDADVDYARSIGILMKKCSGLPGRYTPKTAGWMLGTYIWEKEMHDGFCG